MAIQIDKLDLGILQVEARGLVITSKRAAIPLPSKLERKIAGQNFSRHHQYAHRHPRRSAAHLHQPTQDRQGPRALAEVNQIGHSPNYANTAPCRSSLGCRVAHCRTDRQVQDLDSPVSGKADPHPREGKNLAAAGRITCSPIPSAAVLRFVCRRTL